mmetsp:Transcript_108140/g.272052  ORF Transcript_108140/g.272052 Transcript_108140/m.272052 type:complete len:197 (-) Transcript_108140:183-773(-)
MASETYVVFLPVVVGTRKVAEPDRSKRPSSDIAVHFKKTRPCRFFPNCKHGTSCPFAHSQDELRPGPNFTKTRMCAGWADGRCKLDPSKCKFAHGPKDLRSKAPMPPAAEVGSCSTITSLTSIGSSSSGSASSRASSRGSTAQTVKVDSMQLVVDRCIKSITEARPGTKSEPSGGMPSPEECEAVLLQAMPDQYED